MKNLTLEGQIINKVKTILNINFFLTNLEAKKYFWGQGARVSHPWSIPNP